MDRFSMLATSIVISMPLAITSGCKFHSGSASAPQPVAATPPPLTCPTSDSNLLATNIRSGISILGVSGTYEGAYAESSFASGMRRSKGFSQMTRVQEVASTSAFPLSITTGYSAIPRFLLDNDSRFQNYFPASVDLVNRMGWGSRTCGTTETTIEARIASCATEFGADATWNGEANGTEGEATWKLVARTGDIAGAPEERGREVWQDQRTKLLWSSRIDIAGLNWCRASGKNNITGNPVAENDPSGFCNAGPHQNSTASGLPAISACFEDGEVNFTTTDNLDGKIDNNGKAGLNLASTPAVHWRLPSRNDYFQAEVDGIRFILPDMLEYGNSEWTSTMVTGAAGEAYTFDSGKGGTTTAWRNGGLPVHCVGR